MCNKYNRLVKKRAQIEERQNFLTKFRSINRVSSQSDRFTKYYLSDVIFNSKPKIERMKDSYDNIQTGTDAENFFVEHFLN